MNTRRGAYKPRAKTRQLWDAILQEFAEQRPPMTVRQMYYRMSAKGIVPKDETQGYRPVQRALSEMRKSGEIPYSYIADEARWVRKATTYASLEDAAEQWARMYRRQLWLDQNAHVEVWLEKDALAGVVVDVTSAYDVPLYVTKGYPSLTYLHDQAEALSYVTKPIFIYHFGDYDASGQDAARTVREGLAKFGAKFTFVQAAVTPAQIFGMGLQTRPSKKSDPRARRHGGQSVELDAIPPAVLRQIVEDCITQHLDQDALSRTRRIEARELQTVRALAASMKRTS